MVPSLFLTSSSGAAHVCSLATSHGRRIGWRLSFRTEWEVGREMYGPPAAAARGIRLQRGGYGEMLPDAVDYGEVAQAPGSVVTARATPPGRATFIFRIVCTSATMAQHAVGLRAWHGGCAEFERGRASGAPYRSDLDRRVRCERRGHSTLCGRSTSCLDPPILSR